MATLVSPGVSVSVVNESFFIPTSAPTVPLIFVATKAGKFQPNGITPAPGTLEHSVVRTVTSLNQSLQLYGVPSFRTDVSGQQQHGDARNEYGLLALNGFLGVGNRAYVIRANVNLDDEPIEFTSFGTPVLGQGSIQYNGIGNGTLTNVAGASALSRPQTITVTITGSGAPATFSVVGSLSGHIGSGVVGTAFVSTTVNFQLATGAVAFVAGDKFTFDLVNSALPGTNTGNGRVIDLRVINPEVAAVSETLTLTFTTASAFNVLGSVSGPAASGVLSSPYVVGNVTFTVLAGATAFAAGDTFTITTTEQTISSPLGASDAARRVAIVTALQAEINSNTEARSSIFEYNLIACPGYSEVVDELNALSVAVKEEAIVIADTPANRTPEQVAAWALTSERFSGNNTAYYYPWALQSNLDGRDVLGAPSGVALRTIAFSDTVGYVWTPPAGVSRGVVTGVSKVGYFTGTAGTATTFVEANLNDGQRDALYEYDKNINPIVFFPGRGILVWGQKTSATAASALDRINVARLVAYLRRSLRKGALPFVFEPNDQITRDNLKTTVDSLLNQVLIQRGLYDYASICDLSNNTPDRIDRNELWIDVAIKPVKAAEFVYIPIRVVNTGTDI